MKNSKQMLLSAGMTSFAVALFQAVITFSPAWSGYFGAPEALVSNIPLLYAAGFSAIAVFVIFGLYGISGAGYIRPLPLLRPGLLGIGCVYLLRGILAVPILLATLGHLHFSEPIPDSGLASSLVSLSIGILYLAGIFGRWKDLKSSKNQIL